MSISNNIMKIWSTENFVQYATGDDELVLSFEKSEDWPNNIQLIFYTVIGRSTWSSDINWFREMRLRIKLALEIIFSGAIELQHSHILYNEEEINSFIEALEEGKNHLTNKETEKEEQQCKNS